MIGQSFAPLGDPNDLTAQGQNGGSVNPVQEAIKTLSLRMPRTLGAGAPVSRELLTGLGGASMNNPLSAILLQLLKQAGMGQPAGAPPMSAPSSMGGGGPMAPMGAPSMPGAPQAPSGPVTRPKFTYQENDPSTMPAPPPPPWNPPWDDASAPTQVGPGRGVKGY
jgi:hypothetical protein